MSSPTRRACDNCERLQLLLLQAEREIQFLYITVHHERLFNLQMTSVLQDQQRQLNDFQAKLSRTMLTTQTELLKRSWG